MSALSNYLENKILDHVLGGDTYTQPETLYAALFLTNPYDDDSGVEVTGGSYTRQEITFSASNNGVSSNSNEVAFTASGGDFGLVKYVAIFDASTGGNMLIHGGLSFEDYIATGGSLQFAVGSLEVKLD